MRDVAIVINARTASTRLSNKLTRNFVNTTLLDIALSKLSDIPAKEKYLAAIDEDILEIHRPYKKEVQLLPRTKESVVKGERDHSIAFAHYKYTKSNYILIMNPCLPFSRISTYSDAIQYFQQNPDIKTLTSVVTEHNIFFNHNDEALNLMDPKRVSTKLVHPIKRMAHIFHIINRDSLLDLNTIWTYQKNDPGFFEVSKGESFDIDDIDDFRICEALYSGGYNSN